MTGNASVKCSYCHGSNLSVLLHFSTGTSHSSKIFVPYNVMFVLQVTNSLNAGVLSQASPRAACHRVSTCPERRGRLLNDLGAVAVRS
jgi:hypothetical protein